MRPRQRRIALVLIVVGGVALAGALALRAFRDNVMFYFDPSKVARDGVLQTEGVLPANASSYKQLLVTLETQRAPRSPGQIVLQGAALHLAG